MFINLGGSFQEYLTLDGKEIRIYQNDGRRKGSVITEDPINRLLYASQINLFVGWTYEDDLIVVRCFVLYLILSKLIIAIRRVALL